MDIIAAPVQYPIMKNQPTEVTTRWSPGRPQPTGLHNTIQVTALKLKSAEKIKSSY